MRKVIFLGLAILLSTSALAKMQYSGTARITDHFEEYHVSLPSELREESNNKIATSVMAHANESKGRAGTQVYASADVSWYIKNNTSVSLVYYPESWVCINDNDCYHGKDTVIANSYDEARASGTIFTSAPIRYPGTYAINAIIQITGAEKAISRSNAKLIVTN